MPFLLILAMPWVIQRSIAGKLFCSLSLSSLNPLLGSRGSEQSLSIYCCLTILEEKRSVTPRKFLSKEAVEMKKYFNSFYFFSCLPQLQTQCNQSTVSTLEELGLFSNLLIKCTVYIMVPGGKQQLRLLLGFGCWTSRTMLSRYKLLFYLVFHLALVHKFFYTSNPKVLQGPARALMADLSG